MPVITQKWAAPGLVLGCVIFGLGSLIVNFVPVGAFAIAFWRLLIAGLVFWWLMRRYGQRMPQNRKARRFALLSGVFLGFDLAFWHESIYAVGQVFPLYSIACKFFFWPPLLGFSLASAKTACKF